MNHISIDTLANAYSNVVCLYLNPEGILRLPNLGKIKGCSSSSLSIYASSFLHPSMRTNNQFLVNFLPGAKTCVNVLPCLALIRTTLLVSCACVAGYLPRQLNAVYTKGPLFH